MPRPSQPPPRQGPRPLALHLNTALTVLLSSSAGLPLSRSGSLPWRPDLRDRAAALRRELESADPRALERAVDREARRRADAVLTGIERYRRHPYRRDLPDPPVLWREGSSRLLDYGSPGGVPVLFVPSLINRHYILDLSARRSLMRWLAARGIRPFLLDWGRPGVLERTFSLTDYVAGRLERVLETCVATAGGPVRLVGYCMGGLLAAALAQRRPRDVTGLVLLATPWDFHAGDPAGAVRAAAFSGPWLDLWGELPVDALQALFASLDPMLGIRKFARFAALDPDGEEARAFVALEDWLNDGVPLSAPVARECLEGWYGRNDPAHGNWRIAGEPVDPGRLAMPVLVLVPEKDRIVPPESARALAAAIPHADVRAPALGHIGMIVGGTAERLVYHALSEWLTRSP